MQTSSAFGFSSIRQLGLGFLGLMVGKRFNSFRTFEEARVKRPTVGRRFS